MSHQIEFEKIVSYDAGKNGITVSVELRLGADVANFAAKIDSGSTYCIFERVHGEKLGLDIEAGMKERIGTATGAFWAFGHEVTLIVEGFEFDSVVFFAEDENFRRNVLGRHGWLNRMKIGIVDYDGELYLNRY